MNWILISEELPPARILLYFMESDGSIYYGFRAGDIYHRMTDGMALIQDHDPEFWAGGE